MAILLLGESGSGKSSLAMRWPSPWFCLGDKNIKHAALWAKESSHAWFYDDPERDASGKELAWSERWTRADALLKENGPKPEVKTIIDDSLTHLTGYLEAHLIHLGSQAEKALVIGGEKVMTMTLWSPFQSLLKKRIIQARSYGKPYIMIAHLQVDENEMSGAKEQKVLLRGALKNELGLYFTDIWALESIPSTDAKYVATKGIRYFVRTAPTHRIKLKNSCGLPAEVDAADLIKTLGLEGAK